MNEEHHRSPRHDGDEVARLLRLMPPRPPVPAALDARARLAAEEEWRRIVRRRSRRRSLGYAGGALAAGIALALAVARLDVAQSPQPAGDGGDPGPLAVVEALHGEVIVSPSAEPSDGLGVGGVLTGGAVLETAADGRVALRLAGGQSLRLDVATKVEMVAADAVLLSRGAIYIDSARAGGSLEVRTPLGIARNLGTQFEVRLEADAMRVRVREGRVRVERGDHSHEALAGVELRIGRHGAPSRGSVKPYGPAWRWNLEIAPTFELEGSSLAGFLAWVTRENGWKLRFAEPSLEAYAASVTLHGALDQITPDQAPALVLPTCGLGHRLEAGVLIVDKLR